MDTSPKQPHKKRTRYPSGAYKLLVYLLYGQYPHLTRMPRGIIKLESVNKLAVLLHTKSFHVNNWLNWLESQGYIECLTYSPDRRQCVFRVKETCYAH